MGEILKEAETGVGVVCQNSAERKRERFENVARSADGRISAGIVGYFG
jgi:hypothetical protein